MPVAGPGVVVAGAGGIFFAAVFFSALIWPTRFVVDAVTAGVDVLIVGSAGDDVAIIAVVVAVACVLVAVCGELVAAVEVAAVSSAPPPELVIPAAGGRENDCMTVNQLLPDAAVTA